MFISIVIPTYNRKPILEKCLYALEKQRLAIRPNLRILVIHGDNDIDIPIEFVDTSFKETWDQPVDIVNDDHNLDVVRRKLYRRIGDFLTTI